MFSVFKNIVSFVFFFLSFTASVLSETFNHYILEKKNDTFKKNIWIDSFAFQNSESKIELCLIIKKYEILQLTFHNTKGWWWDIKFITFDEIRLLIAK